MGAARDLTDKGSFSEFQVFIKPVGAACNLSCSYCYYLKNTVLHSSGNNSDRSDDSVRLLHSSGNNSDRSDDSVRLLHDRDLELYTKQQIEATAGDVITFSWHGGEPLLAGIEFFRKAVAYQKANCPQGKRIINGIQTNGILINESWCRFFKDEEFIVGLSMDGPEAFHNFYRKDKQDNGTFRRVLDAFDMLTLHEIDPELLCVVNRINGDHPLEIYGFFRELGVSFITFIPLVERAENGIGESSVDPVQFGEFLCRVFDEWKENDIGKIKVQIFEEALRTAFGRPHTLCVFRPECGRVPVVEHNGDFYSCDHFVNPEHLVGNIRTASVGEMLRSESQRNFGKEKYSSLPVYCLRCEVLEMCHGECPKNRFILTPDGEPGLNYLCPGYRQFFNHCKPFINAVAALYKS